MDPNDPLQPNPYSPQSGVEDQHTPRDSTPIVGELVAESAEPSGAEPTHRRWWTPFAVVAFSLMLFLMTSGVMTLIAILLVHGEISRKVLTNPQLLQEVSSSRIGLFVMVVIPQVALVIPSVAAAILSPVETRQRLGLVRGHWPVWAWVAAAAATPLVGMVSGLVVGIFMEESETLKEMSNIFREHGQSGFLVPLALMIGMTPALCEELLFRGYVQTRLTKVFGPAMGIVVASALFALFHMDLVHIVAVFPLGFFLGLVAWRSGSLFPAMLAHFVNNVISVVAVVFAPEGQSDMLTLPILAVSLTVICAGIAGMTAVLIASILYGRPATAAQTV